MTAIGAGLVAGGAAGNLIDRHVPSRGRRGLRRLPLLAGVQCRGLGHHDRGDPAAAHRLPDASPRRTRAGGGRSLDGALTAAEDDAGVRLDVFVAKGAELSRARAGALIDDGLVSVGGRRQRKAYKVAAGDVVEVQARTEVAPEPPSGVEVVYEDDDLLVASKPAGVVVHAAPGVREGTLVDALSADGRELAERAGEGRAGIVHRLDRDVSGLLIVAKTDQAHERLVAAMQARDIERRYLALVTGVPQTDRGKIDAPVGRHPRHRTRMAVLADGKPAVTWFSVKERFADVCVARGEARDGPHAPDPDAPRLDRAPDRRRRDLRT